MATQQRSPTGGTVTDPATGPSRRSLLLGVSALAVPSGASAAASAPAASRNHSAAQIAAQDARNLAAAGFRPQRQTSRYAPLTGGIVHFFAYGQSRELGWESTPPLSLQQSSDNLMIGGSTRAVDNTADPATTSWVPVGSPQPNGRYLFNPLIATTDTNHVKANGETSSVAAINYLRRAYLAQTGQTANRNCRFVVTDCGISGRTIAELSKGANPEVFNRLRNAASAVKATAQERGFTYQVGGMLFQHGEDDTGLGTTYAAYLAAFRQLQQDFLTDVVTAIAGAPAGTIIPWFADQPAPDHANLTTDVAQCMLDWSNTPNSDLFVVGPDYQYPDNSVHLTANGNRWDGDQFGKSMAAVLLGGLDPKPLQMMSASAQGTSILVNLYVPAPPIVLADSYNLLTKIAYPDLGFLVYDSTGSVPITSAAIVGQATVQITLKRPLAANPVVQAGYNLTPSLDWGTNICDSYVPPTNQIYADPYLYTAGVQQKGENIPSWNGAPLINHPYPLANYLAVSRVPVVA